MRWLVDTQIKTIYKMNLDTKFANLKIGAKTRNKRRLSAILYQAPVGKAQKENSNSSSSSSSIDEMHEVNNENNPAQNNGIEAPIALRRSSRKRVNSTMFQNTLLCDYSNPSSKFAKLGINPKQESLETQDETFVNENDPAEYLKQIYLDKTVKLKHNALETIFEEPIPTDRAKGKNSFMSGRKFRRFISFDDTISNMTKKTKKRSLKAKTMTSKTRSTSKFSLRKFDLSQ